MLRFPLPEVFVGGHLVASRDTGPSRLRARLLHDMRALARSSTGAIAAMVRLRQAIDAFGAAVRVTHDSVTPRFFDATGK